MRLERELRKTPRMTPEAEKGAGSGKAESRIGGEMERLRQVAGSPTGRSLPLSFPSSAWECRVRSSASRPDAACVLARSRASRRAFPSRAWERDALRIAAADVSRFRVRCPPQSAPFTVHPLVRALRPIYDGGAWN